MARFKKKSSTKIRFRTIIRTIASFYKRLSKCLAEFCVIGISEMKLDSWQPMYEFRRLILGYSNLALCLKTWSTLESRRLCQDKLGEKLWCSAQTQIVTAGHTCAHLTLKLFIRLLSEFPFMQFPLVYFWVWFSFQYEANKTMEQISLRKKTDKIMGW